MNRANLIRLAGRVPLLSQSLRKIARRFEDGSVVTIRSGRAKGSRWRRYKRYVSGYWIGQYELDVQNALARELRPGDGFLDVGANAGFFSLIGSKLVGPTGWCVSVDPDPANCESISAQRALNPSPNWQILQEAVSESSGRLMFARITPGSPMGHLVGEGDVAPHAQTFEVIVETIDEICSRVGQPRLIKLDVEGFEVAALRGAERTIRSRSSSWLIELHSESLAARTREILDSRGYEFFDIQGNAVASTILPHHVVARPVKSDGGVG